ncbi:hypothetical protein KAI87_04430 [Myxococcota bacterium]|nr:hypothetical protein [Myxococcota bacterium]
MALTSVEGTTLGDQAPYWHTRAEAWTFSHRLGQMDNEALLQLGTYSGTGPVYNLKAEQRESGGGFILELMEKVNIGLWISLYQYNDLNAFVANGVAGTGWNNYEAAAADLAAADPYDGGGNLLSASRKLDLFASWWMDALALETGFHLTWGSTSFKQELDDSAGQVEIDEDSDITTGTAPVGYEDSLDIDKSVFSVSDLGLAFGAGWTGLENVRLDASLGMNFYSIGWEPNGLDDYLDAGGYQIEANLRAHYKLSSLWTVGAYLTGSNRSLGFKPLRQRDGGTLDAADGGEDANLPDPDWTTPPVASGSAEPGNVKGLTYTEGLAHIQLAALARFNPNSKVALYGSAGLDYSSAIYRLDVGDLWYAEYKNSLMAMPFMHLGFQGEINEYGDLLIGATKRWQSAATHIHNYDSRIPKDDNAQGGGVPADPNLDATNVNRREIEEYAAQDISTTTLLIGTRLHYKAIQIIGQLNPAIFLNGPYFISGATTSPMIGWLSLIYDWDFHNSAAESASATSPHDAMGTADEESKTVEEPSTIYEPYSPEPEPEPEEDEEEDIFAD